MKKIQEYIEFAIAAMALIYAFIELQFKINDDYLFIIKIFIVGYIVQLIVIFYKLRFKSPQVDKDKSIKAKLFSFISSFNKEQKKEELKTKKKKSYIRIILSVVAASFIYFSLISFFAYKYFQKPYDFIIIVAEFEGNKNAKRIVFSRLNYDLQNYKDIKVYELREELHNVDLIQNERIMNRKDLMREIGKKHKADIVVHGSIVSDENIHQVIINFELLKKIDYMPKLENEVKGKLFAIKRSSLKDISIEVNLAKKISYLSYFVIGMVHSSKENWSKAKYFFKKSLNEIPLGVNKDLVYFFLSAACYDNKDYKKSIDYLNNAIAINHSFYEAYANLGLSYLKVNKNIEAVRAYDKAVSLQKKYFSTYLNRGVALCRTNKINDCIISYKKAIRLKPNFYLSHLNLGITYLKMNKINRAINCFKKVIIFKPDLIETHFYLGISYSMAKDYRKTIKHMNIAINQNYEYIKASRSAAFAYSELKQYSKALEVYKKIMKSNQKIKDKYKLYTNVGLAYYRMKDYSNAMKYFNMSKDLKSDDFSTNINIVLTFIKISEINKAEATLKKVHRNSVKNKNNYYKIAGAYASIGNYYARNNKLKKSIHFYKESINVFPEDAKRNCNLGIVYSNLKKYNSAIKYLKQSIKLNPYLDLPYKQLSYIFASIGNKYSLEKNSKKSKHYYELSNDYRNKYRQLKVYKR